MGVPATISGTKIRRPRYSAKRRADHAPDQRRQDGRLRNRHRRKGSRKGAFLLWHRTTSIGVATPQTVFHGTEAHMKMSKQTQFGRVAAIAAILAILASIIFTVELGVWEILILAVIGAVAIVATLRLV